MEHNPKIESGQTTTEYGLILVIVSIAAAAVLALAAGSVVDFYSEAARLIRETIT